jgi:hypothetical protein
MRELLHTGYMSNRGRQVVASFLLHDLKLDWRLGAAWFESQLIDHDVPSNYGNWTFQAGVAFDPRSPYRYFNIHKQAAMYDPHHTHVKLWLPELKEHQAQAEEGVEVQDRPAAVAAAATAVASVGDAHGVHSALYPYPKPIVPLQSDSHHSSSLSHGGDRPERKKKVQAEQKQQQQQPKQQLHHDPTPGCNGMEAGAGGEAPPELHQQRRPHVRNQNQQQQQPQQQLSQHKDGPVRPAQRVQQQQRLQHQPQHEPQQGRSHHGRSGGDRGGWRDSRGTHNTAHSGRIGDAGHGPRAPHDAPRFAHNPFDRNAIAHSNSGHSLNRPGSSYRSGDSASSSSSGGGGGGDSRPLQVIRDLGMRPAPISQRERPALNTPLQPPSFRRPS